MTGARIALPRPGAIQLRSVPRPSRRTVVAVATAAFLLFGGYLWLRDSSLVAVRRVTVLGLAGTERAPGIRAALRNAALDMTTLHVRVGQLRSAVSPYPAVRDIRVQTDFPHGLRIRVFLYDPVAVVTVQGRRIPVAADGTLLPGSLADRRLTPVAVDTPPGGGRLTDRTALRMVTVIGAAPRPLRPMIRAVQTGHSGLRVRLRGGLELRFGTAADLAAKWAAATRILASPAAEGASYIDVRAPERAVAGPFSDLWSADGAQAAAALAPPQATPTSAATTQATQGAAAAAQPSQTEPAGASVPAGPGAADTTTAGGAAPAQAPTQPQTQPQSQP